MDEIANYTGLSRHAVSYQLKKLKYSVEDGNISDVLHSQGLVDRSALDKLEFDKTNLISGLVRENMQLIQQLENDQTEPIPHEDIDRQSIDKGGSKIVIDGINVICVPIVIANEEDGTPDLDVKFEVSRLKFMIDHLRDQGYRVISCMTTSAHSFLLSSSIEDQDKRRLVKMEKSGDLLVLDDYDTFYRRLDHNSTIISNDARLTNGYYPVNAKISGYIWEGPEPIIENLDEIVDNIAKEEIDDQNRAREIVYAMLSSSKQKNGSIPIASINFKWASEFLNLKREDQHNWPEGWSQQLKQKLQLSGKKFSVQIKRLMGDEIEFVGKTKIRRKNNDD